MRGQEVHLDPALNRPTLKMEKQKGTVKMCDIGIRIREDEVRWFLMEVVRQCWKLGYSSLTLNLPPVDQPVV